MSVLQRKWGSCLGTRAPEGAFHLPVSFSHRRVGSSILASLSEAGGNEFRKAPNKPLPPRSPLSSTRFLNAPTQGTVHGMRQLLITLQPHVSRALTTS
jgi:hypothetical protein